jgi:predicted transcriptional regulator
VLEILAGVPEATLRFELARLAAGLGAAPAVDKVLADARQSLSPAATLAARHALQSYVAGAILLPYDAFLAAARSLRYDVDQLATHFHASFEQACLRLVSLRRPGAQAVRFGLVRSDAAGRVTRRVALPRLPFPAHGPGCPLWAVYVAFQAGGALVRQLAQFPGGDRYLMAARALEKPASGFAAPRQLVAMMLVCESLDAVQTVYGDGLDLSERAPAVAVGQACRVCVRQGCAHRQEDPIVAAWPALPVPPSPRAGAHLAGGRR